MKNIKANLKCVKSLEDKQWYDIAVNRLYYYVYQNLLKYIALNKWDEELKKYRIEFKEKENLENEGEEKKKYLGSHQITFTFVLSKLKKSVDIPILAKISDEFGKLRLARSKADYDLSHKYESRSYFYERKNFDDLVERLKKINIIGV